MLSREMASAAHLAHRMASMCGTTASSSPVSSNMTTHRLMVMRVTPARKALAPTMANTPPNDEVPPLLPLWTPTLKNCATRRPKSAPPLRAGMMMPLGSLMPAVMVVVASTTSEPYSSQSRYASGLPCAWPCPSFAHTHESVAALLLLLLLLLLQSTSRVRMMTS